MARARLDLPSLERLKELFFYDEEDGELYNRTTRCAQIVAGSLATIATNNGYLSVTISDRRYLAHRIIWKMVTGRDPVEDIDHKDTNRKNNRFANLREASNFQNCHNSGISIRNTSGVKGIYFNAQNQTWRARIMKDRKVYEVGSYGKLVDAKAAIVAAREELHGEFARVG